MANLSFSDGDFDIALVERTYRVHKEILKEKSQVFADMILIGTPDSEVPLIQLQDEQEPFELFLHALYDHDLDPYIPKWKRDTTKLFARTLDISNKYGVPVVPMLNKFTPYVNRDWPDTLSGWDAIEEHAEQLGNKIDEAKEDPVGKDDLPEPTSAIRFAYLYAPTEAAIQHLPRYLPAAFYHLARLPPEADVDAVAAGYWDVEGGRSAKYSWLRHRDMMCLFNGMHNLRHTAADIAFSDFIGAAKGDATANEGEKDAMVDWWRSFAIERLLGSKEIFDPLAELQHLANLLAEESTDSECVAVRQGTGEAYRDRMQEWLKNKRQEIWDELANHFSLFEFFY